MFWRGKIRTNEFTVFVVFAAVALIGLINGIFVVVSAYRSARPDAAAIAAAPPTAVTYRGEARLVLGPFLEQALKMDSADIAAAGGGFLDLTQKTQERLLRLRVPKEERETHLALVLLLDQWKRALNGSVADQKNVVKRTSEALTIYPWLAAAP